MNCSYCGIETNLDYCNYSQNQLTLDRIYNSDNHRIKNCLICCLKCNTTRSNDNTSAEFKKLFECRTFVPYS